MIKEKKMSTEKQILQLVTTFRETGSVKEMK